MAALLETRSVIITRLFAGTARVCSRFVRGRAPRLAWRYFPQQRGSRRNGNRPYALHRADGCPTIATMKSLPMIASLPWSDIDTVLLDMDGSLLDLHFDNQFWLEHLPQRYAERHGISRAMAELELAPLFNEHEGRLTWYCLDYWTRELELPIREMKREVADLIALRPAADEFLAALREAGKQVVLITNAHRDSLSLKLER